MLTSTPSQPAIQQALYQEWFGEDEGYYYHTQKHERGGRKKKKKNKAQARVWDWDDIYDPSFPNNYADYKGSEEQYREHRDWKARLYHKQIKEAQRAEKKDRKRGTAESDEEENRPRNTNSGCLSLDSLDIADLRIGMFAPPSNLNFAPPSSDDNTGSGPMDVDGNDYYSPDMPSSNDQDRMLYNQPPALAPDSVPDDATGEDAYMRRMRMSGMGPAKPTPPPPPPSGPPAVESAKGQANAPSAQMTAKMAKVQENIAAMKAKMAAAAQKANNAPSENTPPPPSAAPEQTQDNGNTISRAPVRYNSQMPTGNNPTDVPEPPIDAYIGPAPSAEEANQPRSNRPGQKGFAKRLMESYGWEKGQGLGAKGEGITTAIVAKAEKRKKLPDAEGGGWARPANMGKIVGGKKRKVEGGDGEVEEENVNVDGKFGPMSSVVKFEGMLKGLDVAKEIEEKNLLQEIGEEMGKEYGVVERIFVWRASAGGDDGVFIKFTSELSALKAVREMDGAEFAGNVVQARFFDGAKFEGGEYD